jgi:hypothetical protein
MSTSYMRSKWTKYTFMSGSEGLRPHIPKTRLFTQKALWKCMNQYGDVILKPVYGSRGAGVFRLSSVGHDEYLIHCEKISTFVHGKKEVFDYLNGKIESRSYIVQRRVHLAKVNDHPFDIRVIVQRRGKSDSWKVTGKVAKVAGKGYVVTNITRSGGTVLPVKTAIQSSSLKLHSRRSLLSEIETVALLSARILSKRKLYSNQRIFGFDMGLDQEGRVWIIEANLKPMLSHFRKLKDRTMYRRILKHKGLAIR